MAALVKIKELALLSVAVLVAETNGFEGFTNQPVRRCGHLVSYAGYEVKPGQRGQKNSPDRRDYTGSTGGGRVVLLVVQKYEKILRQNLTFTTLWPFR